MNMMSLLAMPGAVALGFVLNIAIVRGSTKAATIMIGRVQMQQVLARFLWKARLASNEAETAVPARSSTEMEQA